MRICCPQCKHKFDLAHRKVLAEADRLRNRESEPEPAESHPGNVLDPNDREAVRLREEAIARRVRKALGVTDRT